MNAVIEITAMAWNATPWFSPLSHEGEMTRRGLHKFYQPVKEDQKG